MPMNRLALVVAALAVMTAPAFAARDYDKSHTTKAYTIRLRIPAAAMAIPPLEQEILLRFDKNASEIKSQSTSDLKEMPQLFHPYTLDTNWRVTFEDGRLISLSGDSYIDEDGAHPNGAFDTVVWDKTANRAVPLEELFVKERAPAAIKAIAAAARKAWIDFANAQGYDQPVDPAMADEGIGHDAAHLGHYALTHLKGDTKANGIVLLWGAGEAWAHVMGDVRLAIPVTVFRKYLAPEWVKEFR
jgi:hypothetical protein